MEHMHRSTEAAAVDLLEAFLHDVLSQESGWDFCELFSKAQSKIFQHIPAVVGCIGDQMGARCRAWQSLVQKCCHVKHGTLW